MIRDMDGFLEMAASYRRHICFLLNSGIGSKIEADAAAELIAREMGEKSVSDGTPADVRELRRHAQIIMARCGESVRWYADEADWVESAEKMAKALSDQGKGDSSLLSRIVSDVRGIRAERKPGRYHLGNSVVDIGLVTFNEWYGPLPQDPDASRAGAVEKMILEGERPGVKTEPPRPENRKRGREKRPAQGMAEIMREQMMLSPIV